MFKNQPVVENNFSGKVIGSAIEVHKTLGPGLLESIYEECFCIEFDRIKISYERQKEIPSLCPLCLGGELKLFPRFHPFFPAAAEMEKHFTYGGLYHDCVFNHLGSLLCQCHPARS